MREKKDRSTLIIALLMIALLVSVILVGGWYYRVWSKQRVLNEEEAPKAYTYHCAFISSKYEDPFCNSIYEGAKTAGEEAGIYVENYGRQLSLNYSINELLQMAIAANVDAIILEGNQEYSTVELINQAMDQGERKIVVVTVAEDSVGSKRCSFIGENKFRMGYDLCSQALAYADEEDEEILVLLDHMKENTDNNIVISGMQKLLDENKVNSTEAKKEGTLGHSLNYKLNSQTIDSSEAYNAEEQIRMLIRNLNTRPDIIICTSLTQTKSVYQSIVDLNCVGKVKVIGFYYDEAILEAIEKGIIQSTYVVDANEIGVQAVNSIGEYKEYGYVSDYVSVDAKIVDQKNVRGILQKLQTEEETG